MFKTCYSGGPMRASKWLPLLFVTLLIGGIALPVIPVISQVLYSSRSFEADHWRSGDVRQRARMVSDLLRREVLSGKSRAEIADLLGPPDGEGAVVWEYDYIYGDLIGDAFELPFSGWRYSMCVRFDHAPGSVSDVDTRD